MHSTAGLPQLVPLTGTVGLGPFDQEPRQAFQVLSRGGNKNCSETFHLSTQPHSLREHAPLACGKLSIDPMMRPVGMLLGRARPPRHAVSRQREAENIASRGDGHVLLALNGIAHGRRTEVLSGVEVPQGLSGQRLHSFD